MKHGYKSSYVVFLITSVFFQCLESKVTPLRPKCKYSCCPGPRGAEGIQGEQGIQGPAGVDLRGANYLFAYDKTAQVITMPGSFQQIYFDTVAETDGWIQGMISSEFTCTQTGLYTVDCTITIESTLLNTVSISLIGQLNGVEIPGSQFSTTVAVINRAITYTKKFMMNYTAGQIFTLAITATDPNVTVQPGGEGNVKPSCSFIIQRVK